LVAASEARYTKLAPPAEALDTRGMAAVIAEFVAAAERAAEAGFDLLEINMGHGYLLGGFLSPISNRRTDGHGGSLEARARFPLEVFDAVRSAWPGDRPLGVALLASDWTRTGFQIEDALAVAALLRARGCDLIRPLAGQTTVRDNPVFGRFFLVPFSDRIRNEAGVPTLVGGNLTTNDEINTILAAGRADLCVLDPRS
jgi:anthraniloyl-CoA monooxygenase